MIPAERGFVLKLIEIWISWALQHTHYCLSFSISFNTNHTLVKSNYSLNSIMKMIPAERGFVLKLIEKDKQ